MIFLKLTFESEASRHSSQTNLRHRRQKFTQPSCQSERAHSLRLAASRRSLSLFFWERNLG